MAADNYSDVVQALAQQIVEACMQTLKKNMQGMISSAVISADQIEGDVSNVNTSNLVMNVDNITGLNDFVAGAIRNADIDISQVATLGEDGKLYLNDVYINRSQVDELEARFAEIWTADIYNANIQKAVIDALHANFAQIADAQIGQAKIDSAQITDLEAEAARIAKAEIGDAKIDWAQIKSLTADDVIIQKGLGGKLYIADLAVTEANMVSLTVGQLVVKGEDGGYYQVTVETGPDGTPTLKAEERIQIGNDEISDLSINAGEKIVEGSVTAATLNAEDIFVQNALINKMIAQNINVSELFARQAFIEELNAVNIVGNESLQLALKQLYDDTMKEVSIRLSDQAIISTVTGSTEFSDAINQRTRQTVTVTYCISDSGTVPPGDEADWQSTIPEAGGGDYLWTKTLTEYANGGEPCTVYTVTQFGVRGADVVVIKITSESGMTYRPEEGSMTLTADVYAGSRMLSQAEIYALGGIQWFIDGKRLTADRLDNWHQITIDPGAMGTKAVIFARLMG